MVMSGFDEKYFFQNVMLIGSDQKFSMDLNKKFTAPSCSGKLSLSLFQAFLKLASNQAIIVEFHIQSIGVHV
jgi:hypothetical protein